jgi:shikimate kinase
MSRPHVVLVGMMGAGKSTVGARLAQRLDRPFLDSDELVEAQTGRTVAEIFAAEGEAAFRAIETSVLLEMLDREVPAVIAAAGGVVLESANRAAMRDRATVVWLRVDPTVLASRVGAGGHRPLLADDPAATLSRLAAERESLYRAAAHEIVDVDGLTPDEVVDRVIVEIGAVA